MRGSAMSDKKYQVVEQVSGKRTWFKNKEEGQTFIARETEKAKKEGRTVKFEGSEITIDNIEAV
jgi:hypothetical protein